MSTATMPAWPTVPIVAPRTTSASPAATCACTKSVALTVQRGATLACKITVGLTDNSQTPPVTTPIDLTGSELQFTAKPDNSYADDDPQTVIVDWQETTTPTQGITWLTVPAETTQDMLTIAYVMQVRMVSPTGVVTPLLAGTLTITEPPASARF